MSNKNETLYTKLKETDTFLKKVEEKIAESRNELSDNLKKISELTQKHS